MRGGTRPRGPRGAHMQAPHALVGDPGPVQPWLSHLANGEGRRTPTQSRACRAPSPSPSEPLPPPGARPSLRTSPGFLEGWFTGHKTTHSLNLPPLSGSRTRSSPQNKAVGPLAVAPHWPPPRPPGPGNQQPARLCRLPLRDTLQKWTLQRATVDSLALEAARAGESKHASAHGCRSCPL